MHTHTRTRTHTHAHARTRTHTHAHARTRTRVNTQVQAYTITHVYACAQTPNAHTHTHTHSHTRTHIHTHTHTHSTVRVNVPNVSARGVRRVHREERPPLEDCEGPPELLQAVQQCWHQGEPRTHVYTHAHAHTHTHTHTDTYIAFKHTFANTHTHTHTWLHIHTFARKLIDTHARIDQSCGFYIADVLRVPDPNERGSLAELRVALVKALVHNPAPSPPVRAGLDRGFSAADVAAFNSNSNSYFARAAGTRQRCAGSRRFPRGERVRRSSSALQ